MRAKSTGSSAGAGSREAILDAARKAAQAHGYAGLNFRAIGDEVGIKHASLYHHFGTKADLAAAVARRYWETSADDLDRLLTETGSPAAALQAYPGVFRRSLADQNRMCLASFLAAEHDDLPDEVRAEVQVFADVHVAWLAKTLRAAGVNDGNSTERAEAIYAAVVGAQLLARSRADIGLYDRLMDTYRRIGPLRL
nr:TetR/AcrR family transcriptional regulator [Variovorax boronicumulans]